MRVTMATRRRCYVLLYVAIVAVLFISVFSLTGIIRICGKTYNRPESVKIHVVEEHHEGKYLFYNYYFSKQ